MSEDDADKKADIKDIRERRDAWFWYFRLWQGMSWIFSIIIAGGSAYVASNIGIDTDSRRIVALIVAICAAIQTTLRLDKRANNYREAWIGLDLAIKNDVDVPDHLLDAIRKGENRISDAHEEGPRKRAEPHQAHRQLPAPNPTSS